jgi:hypothetical protein
MLVKWSSSFQAVSFARSVDGATHDREMKGLLDMSETAFDLGHDLNEVIDIESSAGWASNDGHTPFT